MTELDLTPLPPESERTGIRSWRNWLIGGALIAVALVLIYQALTTARVYFLNVDEAVDRRVELADDTFNLQGTVTTEPSTAADGTITFTMSFGGSDAEVLHVGNAPSGLFKLGEQVVAEGRWQGDEFVSDRLLVKHSEEYVEDNPNRVDYELDGSEADIGAPPVTPVPGY